MRVQANREFLADESRAEGRRLREARGEDSEVANREARFHSSFMSDLDGELQRGPFFLPP